MWYSISLLLVLVLVSGFIAYWGDLLGRRMGKRRLTLFGLRPRYTAIVVTTITGMFIAMLTLGMMLATSSYLRKLVVEGERVFTENTALKRGNAQLHKRQVALTGQLERTTEDMSVAMERRTEAETAQAVAEKKAADLRREVDKRSARLTVLENELAAESRKLLSTQTKQVESEKIYRETLKLAREAVNAWRESFEGTVAKTVIAPRGEEIARAVIRPSQLVRRDFINLLNRASKDVALRGAAAGNNGRAIAFARWRLPYRTPSQRLALSKPVTEHESVEAIISRISQSHGDVVVIVRAVGNGIVGKQVPVDVELFNDDIAFRQGQEVARAMVDGGTSEVRIFIQMIQFLRQDVRKAASGAGVIPVIDPDNPEAMFGTISGADLDEFIKVIDRVKDANGQVVVHVVADKDIYASGPMNLSNLKFTVSRPEVNART